VFRLESLDNLVKIDLNVMCNFYVNKIVLCNLLTEYLGSKFYYFLRIVERRYEFLKTAIINVHVFWNVTHFKLAVKHQLL